MTDIVKRLREAHEFELRDYEPTMQLYKDAADEIERLRLRKRPVAFRVKDGDGWILCHTEDVANNEAEKLGGALVQGLYVRGEQ